MKKLITIVLIISFACKDEHTGIDNNSTMPAPINLMILDKDGNNLITKNTSPNIIYAIQSDGRRYYFGNHNSARIDPFMYTYMDTTFYKYYYSDLGVAVASAMDGIKTSYLEFQGKTDTLYIDYQLNKKPSTDPRNPKYVLVKATLNGKEWEHTEETMPPVSIVRR